MKLKVLPPPPPAESELPPDTSCLAGALFFAILAVTPLVAMAYLGAAAGVLVRTYRLVAGG